MNVLFHSILIITRDGVISFGANASGAIVTCKSRVTGAAHDFLLFPTRGHSRSREFVDEFTRAMSRAVIRAHLSATSRSGVSSITDTHASRAITSTFVTTFSIVMRIVIVFRGVDPSSGVWTHT